MDANPVSENPARHRYEVTKDGATAILTYRKSPGEIVLAHTIVPPELEGQGIGSALVRTALDDARAQGLRVVPQCTFVRGWLDRHPDYAGLVA